MEPTMDPAEIIFQLTFIEHPTNKETGTLQVHNIEAKAIFHGKHQVDVICKGYEPCFLLYSTLKCSLLQCPDA
jgi:hypothetical protein